MKLLTKCTTLMLAAFLAGCSEETQHAGGNQPEPGGTDDAGRREVLLTLKNKLALKPVATKAETIATADENAIETLDVYVFASESEAGDNYTLLQRFAYRAEAEATAQSEKGVVRKTVLHRQQHDAGRPGQRRRYTVDRCCLHTAGLIGSRWQ